MTEICLTPIGTSPAWYNPGVPGSGYLLEHEGYRVLVDCGSGVIMSYLDRCGGVDAPPIDAIVISHVHMDHVADLVPLVYGIAYGPLSAWTPTLFLPPGARERLQRMVSMWDGPSDFFESSCDVQQYQPGRPFSCGPFRISSCHVPHFVDSYALRCEAAGVVIGYSADLGPSDAVAEFFRDVDLLVCEATLDDDHDESAAMRGHLSGGEAGDLAQRAKVGQLALTHIPDSNDPDRIVRAAQERYAGLVHRAIPWQPIDVRIWLSHG